ncbi:ABC transporter ATP-binding protein [Brevundimonas sp.]|uniref:ABC transporter ATP-binding protein n=1 Tax=Brevundimonas sp. TaxID=1871086 RepID=UPI003BACE44D
MTNIWRIVRMLPRYRGRVAAVLATSAIIGLIGSFTPFVFRYVVDALAHARAADISMPELIERLTLAVAIFVGFRIALVVLGAIQHWQSSSLWLDNVGSLRRRIFNDMSTLSLRYYEGARVGDIMDRFGAIVPVTHWLRDLVDGTLAVTLQLMFSLTILLIVSPVAGLIMLLAVPFNIYASWRSVQATTVHRRRWQRLGGRMSGILSEMMSQIITVRAFGGEPAVRKRFSAAHEDWRETRIDEWRIDRRWATLLLASNGVALTAVTVIVLVEAVSGRSSLGDVLLVLMLSQTAITTVQPITRTINSAGDNETSAERLVELLELTPTVEESPDAIALDAIRGIAFEGVGFTYPGQETPVLQGVSFAVQPGQTLALVGPSGSGKSTLVKLLLRLYEPTTGRILINGRDIRDFTQQSLRDRIGMVLQDVALFNDTIGANIAFASDDAKPEAVMVAARLAHADAFIRRLPEGYETGVGERGIKLSGGERQRIAVARAILRDPDLVILDEATSALDAESERMVQAGLSTLMQDRTSIVIAHRLSTIVGADEILVMTAGQVVERGDHDGLLAQGGLYRRLHALQFGEAQAA